MKLKKIASLMLAGIMAVSMLAGCKDGASSSTPADSETPVDNSLAAYINEELDDNQKEIVTFASDSALETALKKAAGMIDVNGLKVTTSGWLNNTNIMNTFVEMLDADGNNFSTVFANSDKDKVAANIYVVPGNFTEDGMKSEIISMLDGQIKASVMPSYNGRVGGKAYNYSYDGKIAVVKVESNDGAYSAYVIGIVVEQTAAEVVA